MNEVSVEKCSFPPTSSLESTVPSACIPVNKGVLDKNVSGLMVDRMNGLELLVHCANKMLGYLLITCLKFLEGETLRSF